MGSAAGYGPRVRTVAIVVHHSAGDPSIDWQAIANYHVNTRGYIGIGYHIGCDPDGTVNQLGDLDSQRAHVAKRNHELVGICLRGNFMNVAPPVEQLSGLSRAIAWLKGLYGDLPVMGHRDAALPNEPTACPGDTYRAWL